MQRTPSRGCQRRPACMCITLEPSMTVPKGRLSLERVSWVPRLAAERVRRGRVMPATWATTSCCHGRMRCAGLFPCKTTPSQQGCVVGACHAWQPSADICAGMHLPRRQVSVVVIHSKCWCSRGGHACWFLARRRLIMKSRVVLIYAKCKVGSTALTCRRRSSPAHLWQGW